MIRKLVLEELRRKVRVEEIRNFMDSTAEGPIELVGQERAEKALDLYLLEEGHIRVVKDSSLPEFIDFIKNELRKKARNGNVVSEEIEKDFCYVHNFDNPNRPLFLEFPKGQGRVFKLTLEKLRNQLFNIVPTAILEKRKLICQENIFPEYREKTTELFNDYIKRVLSDSEVKKDLEENGLRIRPHAQKVYEFVLYDLETDEERSAADILPNPLQQSRIAQMILSRMLKSKWAQRIQRYAGDIYGDALPAMNERIRAVEAEEARTMVESIFQKILEVYSDAKVADFLKKLKDYSMGPPSPFSPMPVKVIFEESAAQLIEDEDRWRNLNERTIEKVGSPKPFLPFEVNLIIDNSNTGEIPIITELTPTHASLFGRADRELRYGAEIGSDHMMIRPGKFHEAHGGYLILDLNDIYEKHEVVLRGLKRVLKEKQLRISDEMEELGASGPGRRLTPEPLPLKCKVIAVMKPPYHYLSWNIPVLEDLMQCLPILVEFDETIEFNPCNIGGYIAGIRDFAKEKNFLPCNDEAFAKIFEFLLKEAENKTRMSCNLRKIKNLLSEANLYAKKQNKSFIEDSDISHALKERIHRSDLVQEKINQRFREKAYIVDTKGRKVGQVNGLSIIYLADYHFAMPTRITAGVAKGKEGIISIDKRVGMAGPIAQKAVENISSWFKQNYGKKRDLGLDITLGFEQNYSGHEGDSASLAELAAVVSAVTQIPIRQDMAITGSIDQFGRVQAVGGESTKIEGAYYTWQAVDPDGELYCIIPKANSQYLMLSEEVVAGKVSVYEVETIGEALELLLDTKFSEIDKKLKNNLKEISDKKSFIGKLLS